MDSVFVVFYLNYELDASPPADFREVFRYEQDALAYIESMGDYSDWYDYLECEVR